MAKDTKQESIVREFKLTTMALKNRNTVFLLTIIIIAFGIISYRSLPKELFPEIVIPTVLVQTTYLGNPPVDIENLITRPLEKEIETINGIKELTSTSAQDASMIFVEFNTDVNIEDALADVRDKVDQAKSELPTNDPFFIEPLVMDIDLSEFPIININLSGDYSIEELRAYAEYLEDRIEEIDEISKVEIKGINEREVKINVDLYKMEAMELSFYDIEMAVKEENVSMSGGEILLGEAKRAIRTIGEFENVSELENIIIKESNGKVVYLKDVADVIDGYKEPNSFARLDKQPVVSVQVIKKSGENLLSATNKVFKVLDRARESRNIPADMSVSITNDQSEMVRMQLSNLENSMFMGIIFVVLVLFYFLGTRNALFVGIAIPMSMFLSFVVINIIGFQINMIVLFSLILALGMLVDNAIVTVENIYRYVSRGYKPFEAARQAVGEIAWPIITSTSTTLAAFLPLAFWGGITGEFMKYMPITLIIVLTSSLFVALVIVPVFSATFIKVRGTRYDSKPNKKKGYRFATGMIMLSIPLYIIGWMIPANLLVLFALIGILNLAYFHRAEAWFQDVFLVRLEEIYLRILNYALHRKRPLWFFTGTILLLVITLVMFLARAPKISFFPDNEPGYINVQADLPIGTDIYTTDEFMRNTLEKDIFEFLEPYEDIVESVLTTIGTGSNEDLSSMSIGGTPHKALTTITFVDYEDRGDVNTSVVMQELSKELLNTYPGIEFSITKNQMGPPTGRAINIEVTGQDYDRLLQLTDTLMFVIEQANIEGIGGLNMDLDIGKPELLVHVNREKARRFGLSTQTIASTIRTALFGSELSDYKVGEDEYPINMRLKDEYRYSVPDLFNQKITFVEEGRTIQLPISAVANYSYSTTYGSVRRKNMDRVITIYSNVIQGYNANSVNGQIKTVLADFQLPEGYNYEFTGEQAEQQESMDFLGRAMLIALALILLILVTQFNSVVRPAIILASVVFSTIGVFGGIATFRMDFIIVMTGVGIISLAGIVVNNAIVLVDFIELRKARRRKELGLKRGEFLPIEEATEAVVQAGKTRLRPVLLTAITTILGLLPLAIGINLDFQGLFSRFEPNLYFGGEQVIFWGPMAWTVIFGLTFATFLTLVIVPVMYRLTTLLQKKLYEAIHLRSGNNNQE